MTVEDIARICHEANRIYCMTLGDFSQRMWATAPEWQRQSAITGVRNILDGFVTRPEQSHESWLEEKRLTGWCYGRVKDEVAKTHPCFVPYAQLPEEQRKKDVLFFNIVQALR